jgi:hypothetical protein
LTKATEVFTPNDFPTFTYVTRSAQNFEERLRQAYSIPKMIISLSGPSKSGKTVLINKVIEKDNLIPVSGASIRSADDLWAKVLSWMDTPTGLTVRNDTSITAEVGGEVGGKAGIPFFVEGKAKGTGEIGAEITKGTTEAFSKAGLGQVVKDIAGSSYTVFVDDFHYIPKDVPKIIGRQIKEAAESGVRICTASVPHRSDDVVRSNPELRGRVTAIDTNYWKPVELEQIAYAGFRELNVDVSQPIMKRLTEESFGSPQLMQAICLNFCFENKIQETLPIQQRVEVNFVAVDNILERTSTLTDFSSMLSTLHAGPKQRGTERKEFEFVDGSNGDVYRCILLAMKADPPRLAFTYDEMLQRTRSVCKNASPVGSSVAQALSQMDALAATVQEAPVIEWDENVLDIVEPYFLFFLRCSPYLQKLKQK